MVVLEIASQYQRTVQVPSVIGIQLANIRIGWCVFLVFKPNDCAHRFWGSRIQEIL
jgi:hypothetical protein